MGDRQCRICFDPADGDSLLSPCRCRGTQAYIHTHCLRLYFQHYPDGFCRVCHTYMRRIHPDELLYGIGTGLWCLALVYAGEIVVEYRFMYLLFVGTILLYYFALQQMPLLIGCLVMGISAALIGLPLSNAMQLIMLTALLFLTSILCWYIPAQYLLLAMAIGMGAIYSFVLLMYTLTNVSPLIASLLLCSIAYGWYIAIRARPPF